MGDAKDILGLSKGGPPAAPGLEKRSKAGKDATNRKPEGISREVYALTGGVPPLMTAVDISEVKAKRKQQACQKVSWSWVAFTTSARSDDLQLQHWTRVVEGVPPSGDHPYAKYNKAVDLVRYSEEEYAQLLQHPKWSQEETDHLLDLCSRFDLRFIVIADRYSSEGPFPERSVEELKDRYYSVARALLISRGRHGEEVPDSPLLRDPYNAAHETERKRALGLLLSQSRHQEQEEAGVLAEARRIAEARRAAQVAAAQSFPVRPAAPSAAVGRGPAAPGGAAPSSTPERTASEGTDGGSTPSAARPPRVYVRGVRLSQTVEKAASTAGARLAKRIEQTLEELGVRPKPQVASRAVCAEYIALRKEVVALLNLQKRVQWKENEVTLLRENPHASISPSLGTPKRLARGEGERVSTRGASTSGEAEGAGGLSIGERPGKREVGRKAPLHGIEASPLQAPVSSQQKRNRKLKSSGD